MKRYDSYKDSKIEVLGEVPLHWKTSKFKFLHIERDQRVSENWKEYPLLSLTKQGVILRDVDSGKGKFPESFESYKSIEKGDLIFCLYDIEETPRTVGLSHFDGMITGSYKVFKTTDLLPEFTYYTFQVIDDVKGLKPYYTGLRNVVRPETFKSLPFSYPPLSEQQQIVSFLDTKTSLIDSLIEKTQRKFELLKEKRTSLINEVVTKGLNPNVEMKDSGVEWIGEIPSHWEKRKFKWDIFYQEGPGLRTFQFTESGVRVICVSNITEHGIDFETTHTRHISQDEYEEKYKHFTINDRDILLSSSGSIGKISRYFFNGKPVILNTSTIRIHSSNKENYLDDFVPYVLSSNYIQIQLRFLMTGGIVSNFGPSHLDQLFNYIPPISEQNEIVSYLDEHTQLIDKTVSIEERRIELLKEYRQSLISEVVTGKIDVRVN